ncbi:MAG: UDP-2,4-diacetamido-2,4,6-trideoxy-beta-L-altropyranose hydrolase [Clostridia bacterium]|nr:UDP-2,4-diacetamido-2,4,6-trideoxy-beta-L-altropyranose hydrolase [Clostridia bacterium]
MSQANSVLLRCDGAEDIGLGHVVRCLALAEELKAEYNCKITFAIHRGKPGIDMIKERAYPMITSDEINTFTEEEFLKNAVQESGCNVVIMDFRENISLDFLHSLRKRGIILVDIDDPNEKRLAADLAFYPPVPQVKRMDWSGFEGQLMVGWEWVILRKEFTEYAGQQRTSNDRLHLLVTMGGSDPAGFTLTAIEALDLLEDDFDTTVVLGAAFSREYELQSLLLRTKRKYRILRNVKNMAAVMAEADLAIASFGMTAYELACMGVPALYLCLAEDHAESCQAFVEAGVAVRTGIDHSIENIAAQISPLLWNSKRRARMKANGKKVMDGYGVQRIGAEINKILIT